jgi:hypothetical protein
MYTCKKPKLQLRDMGQTEIQSASIQAQIVCSFKRTCGGQDHSLDMKESNQANNRARREAPPAAAEELHPAGQ